VGPGAAGQLLAGGLGGHRLLVGAGRRHRLERVDQADDAAGAGDVLAGLAVRVATAVVLLVVVQDPAAPLAEPRHQRRRQVGPGLRVGLDPVELAVVELARLVEDGRGDAHLADVVQQGRPAQPVAVVGVQLELGAEHVAEHAHPLGVPAGAAVVRAERRDEVEHQLAGGHRLGVRPAPEQLRARLADRRLPAELEPRRRPVREDHRQLEDQGQRQQAPRAALDHDGHHDGDDEHDRQSPPGAGGAVGQLAGDQQAAAGRGHQRHREQGGAHHRREHRPGPPPVLLLRHRHVVTSTPSASGRLTSD
jgi:hypothetical protein